MSQLIPKSQVPSALSCPVQPNRRSSWLPVLLAIIMSDESDLLLVQIRGLHRGELRIARNARVAELCEEISRLLGVPSGVWPFLGI